MKKQLLLGLFIAIILCALTQTSISQAASRDKPNPDTASISPIAANYTTPSFAIFASRAETSQRLIQHFNQTTQETPTPTITPSPVTNSPTPTRKPRPTPTPITIPPSANPNVTTLMILVCLFAVIVVIVGVWLNRPEK